MVIAGLVLRRDSKIFGFRALEILQTVEKTCLGTPLMLDWESGWTSRLLLRSTRRLFALMKSAPRMGLDTSATWKRHEYFTLSIRIVLWRVPNDLMRVPLAATR